MGEKPDTVDVADDVRTNGAQLLGGVGSAAAIRGRTAMSCDEKTVLLSQLGHGAHFLRILHGTHAKLPDNGNALLLQILEVLAGHAVEEHNAVCVDLGSNGMVGGPDGSGTESLHDRTFLVVGSTGEADAANAYQRGNTGTGIVFDPIVGLVAVQIVVHGGMSVSIDQTGAGGKTVGIDFDSVLLIGSAGGVPNIGDPVVLDANGISLGQRMAEISCGNSADVANNCVFHITTPTHLQTMDLLVGAVLT